MQAEQKNTNQDHPIPQPVQAHQQLYYPHQIQITIKAQSHQLQKYLEIIATVLQVDKELKPETLTKQIIWDQQNKQVYIGFYSRQLKLLRACVTGFLRHVQLVANTIDEFKN